MAMSLSSSRQLRGKSKSSIHHFQEASFFAKNQALGLRHEEILTPFRISLQSRPVALVRGQAVECNQPPGDVVGSFVRKKIADQVPAAVWNDTAPVLGVGLESVPLERIDLISDEADYRVLARWHIGEYTACQAATLRLSSKYGCRQSRGPGSF